jgi:hypothetical protein
VVAGQIYQLSLRDYGTSNAWSSDPASNRDGGSHLASTSTFSDFHLGTAAPTPVDVDCALPIGCYFGWEDLAWPGTDHDFNDLVFALQFTPAGPGSVDPVSEPGTLTLLCAGLLGLGFLGERRWHQVLAVKVVHIEGEEDQGAGLAIVGGSLQETE